MATLTPHSKIKRDLERGEFAKVAYANFLKWLNLPSIKTLRMLKRDLDQEETLFLLVDT